MVWSTGCFLCELSKRKNGEMTCSGKWYKETAKRILRLSPFNFGKYYKMYRKGDLRGCPNYCLEITQAYMIKRNKKLSQVDQTAKCLDIYAEVIHMITKAY